MAHQTETSPAAFDWTPLPEATQWIAEVLELCSGRCSAIRDFADRLMEATGTRLLDWVDHLALPAEDRLEARLTSLGFEPRNGGPSTWEHPGGVLPPIMLNDAGVRRVAVRVESVADFMVRHRLDLATRIEGLPLGRLRKARVAAESDVELWAVERHGERRWEPRKPSADEIRAVLWHQECFRRRKREFPSDEEGFQHAAELIRSAVDDLGVDRTCDLFFAAERENWAGRNRAASVQHARQEALGLGWANHDHHTYRSSREHFATLVAVLESLGLVCRERFYAGREAGWGAQVLEQPIAAVVVFADVDLTPEEVSEDFAHQPLGRRDRFGTVGLWCKLHGEAFLQAGMHHLECRFDFHTAGEQLQQLGVTTMKPFTDLPYLKQAFTEGEVWPVAAERIAPLVSAGAITADQAERFRVSGAIGSHMEILQRDEGYKGFNKTGISEIIETTDPRRHGGA